MIENHDDKSYVYVYMDPNEKGEWRYKDLIFEYKPFYIGKGQNNRCDEHLKEARSILKSGQEVLSRKLRKILKLLRNGQEPIIDLPYHGLASSVALFIEKEMVEFFRRIDDGGILYNYRDGGGEDYKYSTESRLKMSKTASINCNKPERKAVLIKQLDEARDLIDYKKRGLETDWLTNVREANKTNILYCQGWNKDKGGYTLNCSDESRKTRQETCRKNFKNKPGNSGIKNARSRQVLEFDQDMNFIKEYGSINIWMKEVGYSAEKLQRLIRDQELLNNRYFQYKK